MSGYARGWYESVLWRARSRVRSRTVPVRAYATINTFVESNAGTPRKIESD
jgi:hypothetical protein